MLATSSISRINNKRRRSSLSLKRSQLESSSNSAPWSKYKASEEENMKIMSRSPTPNTILLKDINAWCREKKRSRWKVKLLTQSRALWWMTRSWQILCFCMTSRQSLQRYLRMPPPSIETLYPKALPSLAHSNLRSTKWMNSHKVTPKFWKQSKTTNCCSQKKLACKSAFMNI